MTVEELFRKNQNKYVKLMTRILRGDSHTAEDVVQEAFCRAIQYKKSFNKNRGNFETWFNRILFNALRDIQKQNRNHPKDEPADFSLDDLLQEVGLSQTGLGKLILNRIDEVGNEKHKRVLTLFFINGYTSTEISEIEEKVSVSNITTIVSRFREQVVGEFMSK